MGVSMFGLEASRQRTAAVISFNELLALALALALDPQGRPVSLQSSLNGEGILVGVQLVAGFVVSMRSC
jgi:hypothetical protein